MLRRPDEFTFTLYYQNVRSLNNKIHYLHSNIHQLTYRPDFSLFTETWLHPNTSSGELGLRNYTIFRKDRSDLGDDSRGGGVLIGINRNFHTSLLSNNSNTESLFIKVDYKGTKILLALAYIPPDSSCDTYSAFLNVLDDHAASLPDYRVIVGGDFNLRNTLWLNDPLDIGYCNYTPPSVRDNANRVHTAFNMHGSRQYYPVHPAKGYTLDLLFAPENCVVNLSCDDPLVSCDGHHMAQYFSIAVPTNHSVDNSVLLKRDFYGCDYALLNEHLGEVNWDTVFTENDINANVSTFNDLIAHNIASFVPLSRYTPNNFPKWYSSELKCLIIEKKKLHIISKSSELESDVIAFKMKRAQCLRLSRQLYSKYVENTEVSLKKNIKYFWSFVKNTREDTSLPSTMYLNDEEATDGGKISRLFPTHF